MAFSTASSTEHNLSSRRPRKLDIRSVCNQVSNESVSYASSSASTRLNRSRCWNLDDDATIDSHSVDSVDVFWSSLSKRSKQCNQIVENVCPMIRNIRERESRAHVHDEVQLNDDRIISQLYSNYIKDTKLLLNNYLGSGLTEFFDRKRWFLDAGKEDGTTGKGFSEFLIAKRRSLSNKKQLGADKPDASHLKRGGKQRRGEKQRSGAKKNVRFEEVLSNERSGDDETPCDDMHGSDADVMMEKKENMNTSPSKRSEADHEDNGNVSSYHDNISIKKITITSSKKSQILANGAFNAREQVKIGEINKNQSKSIRGILKKDSKNSRSFIMSQRVSNRETIDKKGEVKIPSQHGRKRKEARRTEKGQYVQDGTDDSDGSARSIKGVQNHTKRDACGTWNRGVRLLRGVSFVTGKGERDDENARSPSFLDIPHMGFKPRRSLTPESSSQASSSPTGYQASDVRNMLDAKRGLALHRRSHRKHSILESALKRDRTESTSSWAKHQQYNGLGVEKVAEVTTISSYVRYDFDIPDDLDDNLEHLRIHGYLQN